MDNASSNDEVTAEIVKFMGDMRRENIAELLMEILKTKNLPKEWNSEIKI